MNLKVIYGSKERMFVALKTEKFSELMEKAKEELKIEELDGDWRLRMYNCFEDIMQECYTGREHLVKNCSYT